MARPKESDREDIRALVLKKSRMLFLKYGYENVTMRRIAEEIGYSPAAIYLYFRTKDQIFYELRNEGLQMMYRMQLEAVQAAGANPFEKLKALGTAYLHFAVNNQEYYDLMFMMQDPNSFLEGCDFDMSKGKPKDFGDNAHELLVKVVDECIESGYFRGVDSSTIVFSCWSLVHGMVSLVVRKIMPIPKEKVEPFLQSCFSNYVNFFETVDV